MHWGNNLKRLQVDMTSYCNAKCGACARNLNGGATVPGLKLQHFDTDIWHELAEQTAGNLQKLSLNGNWGDPGMHPQLIPMLETWIAFHEDCDVVIHTNGGMHKPDWWSELAGVLRNHRHRIIWSIDGIGKDHELYRRNTSYDRVIQNLRAFNSAGGNSEWIMTLWDHNYKDVDRAKALATMLGCYWFQSRRNNSGDACPIKNDKGKTEYTLTAKEANEHGVFETIQLPNLQSVDKHSKRKDFPDQTVSKCPWYNQFEVQIDPFHRVWPCCNISIYGHIEGWPRNPTIDQSSILHDDFNDLQKHNIYDILDHEWYNTTLSNSIQNAKLAVCRNNCNVHKYQ
jgi:sulfatase maturation enzyme AslB (radical SAM superfamily)|tara:strand:- start:1240 stop:2262 length:1023 start_codon:yes stop_codon:yes gene_type:complete